MADTRAPENLRVQGRQTRERLLAAGTDVLAAKGYVAARVDDVVAAADVSHGTFYLYFTNKEDLFRAIAELCAEEMKALAATLGPVDRGPDGLVELRRWLGGFLDVYGRHGAVIRAWMEDQVIDEGLIELGLDAFTVLVAALDARLREAAPAHLPDADLAPKALLAMVERFAYFTTTRDVEVPVDVGVDTLATMVHRGFFGAAVPLP